MFTASVCVLLAAVLSGVQSTPADDVANAIVSLTGDHQLADKTFAEGVRQIMSSDLSPRCAQAGLDALAAAQADTMQCKGAKEVAEDIALIIEQAASSTSDFLVDLNTVFNGIPTCFVIHRWWNFPGITMCIFSQFKDVWNAITHFFHFSNYYMATVKVIKEFEECLKNRNKKANYAVETMLRQAQLCH